MKLATIIKITQTGNLQLFHALLSGENVEWKTEHPADIPSDEELKQIADDYERGYASAIRDLALYAKEHFSDRKQENELKAFARSAPSLKALRILMDGAKSEDEIAEYNNEFDEPIALSHVLALEKFGFVERTMRDEDFVWSLTDYGRETILGLN